MTKRDQQRVDYAREASCDRFMSDVWDDPFARLEWLLDAGRLSGAEPECRLAVVLGREAVRKAEELSAENAALRASLRECVASGFFTRESNV